MGCLLTKQCRFDTWNSDWDKISWICISGSHVWRHPKKKKWCFAHKEQSVLIQLLNAQSDTVCSVSLFDSILFWSSAVSSLFVSLFASLFLSLSLFLFLYLYLYQAIQLSSCFLVIYLSIYTRLDFVDSRVATATSAMRRRLRTSACCWSPTPLPRWRCMRPCSRGHGAPLNSPLGAVGVQRVLAVIAVW